jgi:putative PEP-CTERM system histidine kinase
MWLFFLSTMLSGAVAVDSNWLVRRGGLVLGLVLLSIGLLLEVAGLKAQFPGAPGQLLVLGSIVTSLYALVGIEQLYRNARPSQQNGLKFLCLALAGIFAFDLFLYSKAVVDSQINPVLWGARGFVVALCTPFIAVSVKRIPTWSRGIFASRQIVFYTTTLFAAGVYLTIIGFAGYYIQTLGRGWGDVLQLVFFSAAVLGFFALLLSDQLRARIRVWLAKHFFERKYDYRAEWLRLIHTLTETDDGLPLKKRAIKSLAQILDSPSGQLWLMDNEGRVVAASSGWNMSISKEELGADSPLVSFLSSKAWVIDVTELANQPTKYETLTLTDVPGDIQEGGFIVPLLHDDELLGFVALAKPRTPFTMNFEDHDLLKTAGQQIASYLAQEKSTEHLAESRQFEAYNRFTAFVMHDLKNAIAQQTLVVENAEKHKRNPEFIDDAMEAIKGSVERMRRVLGHLRQSAVETPAEKVDMGRILLQVESHCSDREPVPVAAVPDASIYVKANKERLLTSIIHAVRNAQDACEDGGEVTLALSTQNGRCEVSVRDTGCGMDEVFINDRLFRPFDSTKGAEGMGIGAYQIRETLRSTGGDLEVSSEIGVGTTLLMYLPIISKDRT